MKFSKRTVFAALIALCAFAASADAGAQVTLRFDPATPTVSSGGAINARVLANIPAPIIGYGLDLQFDNTALSLTGVEVGPAWFSATSANGSPLVGLAFPDPVSGQDTLLGTLHLQVNQGQCKGTTIISLNAAPDDLTEGFALVTGGFADFTPASATVSPVDATPPVISGASADQPVLWPPNHKLVTVTLNYGVSDNCDAAAALACSVSVSSNEPVNGPGSGNTDPDFVVLDAHHVQLLAERSGTGTGRVYTNTITCTDSSGNSSSQDVLVTVPHDQGN